VSASRGAKKKSSERANGLEGLVWACALVAVGATLFFLMREPEKGDLPHRLVQARMIAAGASWLGAALGVWRVILFGGGPNLFGLAAFFNLLLACYWAMRFLLIQ